MNILFRPFAFFRFSIIFLSVWADLSSVLSESDCLSWFASEIRSELRSISGGLSGLGISMSYDDSLSNNASISVTFTTGMSCNYYTAGS